MKLPGNPRTQWPIILDTFELTFAGYDGYMMWMVDFIRALLTCRGIEQVYPGSSMYSLVVSRWHEDHQDGPIRRNQCGQGGVFTLRLSSGGGTRKRWCGASIRP